MRMSDWSSDVFSSDLFRHGTTDASRWFAAAPQLALATGPVMIPTIDPRIETRWEEVGTLTDYPDPADAGDSDRTYWLILPEPRIFHGLSINGARWDKRRVGTESVSKCRFSWAT